MNYNSIYNTVKNVCFRDVVYANGQWILVALGMNPVTRTFDNTLHICTTSDLKNFNDLTIYTQPSSESYGYIEIAYGNGIFVVTTNYNLFISSDLKNWKKISRPTDAFYNKVSFLNGQFIVTTWIAWTNRTTGQVTRREGRVLTSKNGTDWSTQAILQYGLNGITYYKGNYYVVGTDGYIGRSSNLKSWSICNSGISQEIKAITSGAVGIVAVGDNKTTIFSSDGITWQKVFVENDMEINNIEYGNGIYMIMTSSPSGVAFSRDGINFEWLYRNTGGYQYGMAFSQEQQMFLISGNWWSKDDTGSIRTISISRNLPSTDFDNEVLYIYDLNFNLIEIIDSFKSLRWRRKYFEAGEFEIVLTPEKDKIIDSLKENYLVVRNNYTESGIIETIQYDDNGTDEDITIKGRFLSSILDRRIVKSIINFSGQTVDGMKQLLNQMTPFPNFEIEQTVFDSENITFQCSYKNIYDYLVKLSKYSNVGFRIVPNLENKVFIFENYKGLDRTSNQSTNERYSFSDEEYNIELASLTTSNVTKVNYVLVGGTGEGSNRVLVEVKKENATGFDLYEKFVDDRNQSNNNLSSNDYKNVLSQDGYNSLTEPINEFSFEVNDEDYKKKFDLGDVVDTVYSKWKYKTIERITEVEEVIEDGKRKISIVTGTPLPEIWENED